MIDAGPVKERARALGFTAVGVCAPDPPEGYAAYLDWLAHGHHATMGYMARSKELRADPASLLPGVRSVVVVALNYAQPNPAGPGQPRIARYALGRDYHRVLRGKLRRLGAALDAIAPGSWRVCVDSAPLLEREYAHRAGLGWFGKNTMLIDTRRGSWFLIGALLTTLELTRDAPSLGGCGTCNACVEACPTGCIVHVGGRWQVDARRCLSYLTIEHRGAIDPALEREMVDWTFGCDVCQEVCPFNQPRPHQPERAAVTTEPDFLATRTWPTLHELAEIGESEWDALTRGSALRRAGHDGLRRNAAINLANAQRTTKD